MLPLTTLPPPIPRITPGAVAATLLVVAMVACSARTPNRESSSAPVIASLSPDTVVVRDGEPVELTIRGTGFAVDSNDISVGPVTMLGVRSQQGGTIIRLTVPDRVTRSGAESPPELWVPGAYAVTVANAHGRSASALVVIRDRK